MKKFFVFFLLLEENLNVPVSFCFFIVSVLIRVGPNKFAPDATYVTEFGFIISSLTGDMLCEEFQDTH